MSMRVSSARFIGREAQLEELESALTDAREGRPSLAFIAGESGVGKTRLLRELELRAGAGDGITLGGECIELGGEEVPYAPLTAALRPLVREGHPVFERLPESARCELARLAPELGEAPPTREDDREEEQRQLFDALLALLTELSQEQTVLLWLEDLHWADRSTRSFLVYLARSLRSERVLTIATYRSDEMHRRHPMRPLLAELERLPQTRRIELARFDRDEVRIQLADIAGVEPDDAALDRLFARSEGNPLFSEELLAAGVDGRGAPPPTLRDALLLRSERLSPAAQLQLRMLAVAGRADEELLAEISSTDLQATREALRETIAENVVTALPDRHLGFRHALLREVVYDDLLPGERVELHLQIAQALEARGGDGSPARRAAVAHHYYAAEAQPQALRAAITAGADAERISAYGEATALFERALTLWPRVDAAEELAGSDHAALLLRAARAHYRMHEDSEAIALLQRAADELAASQEPKRRAAVLGELASGLWSQGYADRATDTLQEALDIVGDDPSPERAGVLAHLVRLRLLQGRFREVEEAASEALETADAVGLDSVRAGILNRLGLAIFAAGDYERGEPILRESIEAARDNGRPDVLGLAYANTADAFMIAGRPDEAAELVQQAIAEIPEGDREHRWLGMMLAELAIDRGDWEEAERQLPAPVGRLEHGMTQANIDLLRAMIALGIGDLEAARSLLDSADGMLADAVEPQFLAPAAALRGELESRCGDIDAARRAVERGLDRLQFCTEDLARLAQVAATGVGVEADAAVAACDLGDDDAHAAAVARAERMLERVAISVEDVPHPLGRARLSTAAAELARAQPAEDEPRIWAEAAECWQDMGRPYPRAHALWRQAEAHLARRDRDAAAAAAAAAHEIAAAIGSLWLATELESFAARARIKLGPAPAPGAATAVAEPVERPFGLTERELQVLELVATGATNREIGEQLFMAEKTASVHVSRILAKLDVRGRTEAAALAHRQGLVAPDPD